METVPDISGLAVGVDLRLEPILRGPSPEISKSPMYYNGLRSVEVEFMAVTEFQNL